MADQTPLNVTPNDVQDQNLLLRFLRKVSGSIGSLSQRVGAVEAMPKPLTPAELSRQLAASGAAPLNVNNLLGVLRQPQVAGAQRYTALPSGQPLQQLQDTTLFLVQSTSTTYDLYTVIGGNPNAAVRLISGLSTATVTSTSTNLMTLDTVQTSTGQKTFNSPILAGASTLSAPAYSFSTSTQGGLYSTSSGTVALSANGVQAIMASTSTLNLPLAAANMTGVFSQYHGVTTVGEGLPFEVALVKLTGQTAAIGVTNILTGAPAGVYRVSYYLYLTTLGNAVNLSLTIGWNDGVGGYADTSAAVSCSTPGYATKTVTLRSGAGLNITYQTSLSGAIGTGVYAADIVVERLNNA